ncbi:hypothetical protein [Candidatus Electronema sp. PJ]|uniref:hypothetical protein n=1 Tax=Candidatus Electronema sp. PJ TaxID=3401572 RepID=UPI003AA9270A
MLLSTVRHRALEISAMLAAVTIICTEMAVAAPPPGNPSSQRSVVERLDAYESIVTQQAYLIEDLQKQLAEARKVTDALAPYLTADDAKNIYITGANLHIQSGSGKTDGELNGLGNLIIGYNEHSSPSEDMPATTRIGSHNLVVGPYHSYLSYGGLLAGFGNTVSGPYSSVSGGYGGTASGDYSSVSGGAGGTAGGAFSSVSGGGGGTASGDLSSVIGGNTATANDEYSVAP